MGRTGRSRAATTRVSGAADARTAQAPQLRVVSGEFYPDWEAVYRDNVERVYGLMFAKVGNRPDAEDLTAEVFLTALRPLRVSASAPEARAYLLATARTVLAGYWRRRLGREITTLDDNDDLEPVPADATASADAAGRAAAILAELPEQYRRILQLRFLDSCSVREDLLRGRRPRSFRADETDVGQLRTAITLRAALNGIAVWRRSGRSRQRLR